MKTYVALLRGINVGGHKMVAMADLRDLFTRLGFAGAHTLLQSGNVVFRGGAKKIDALERLLEVETEKRLGVQCDYLVRTADEWKSVIAHNPFPDEARRDPGHLIVMFLRAVAGPKDVEALQAAITGPEIVRGHGRQAYIVYPDGMGRSRLTINVIEKKLGTRATGRNWNTVSKLGALSEG